MKTTLSEKAIVVHDVSGQIISIGRVPANVRARIEVRPGNAAHKVLEIDLDPAQAAMPVSELHKSHKVHVASKTLVTK